MWLIAGLGNPGTKYKFNRHNIGFMIVDAYLAAIGQPPQKAEHHSLTYKINIDDQVVLLVKPQTFMNKSGDALQSLVHFYKILPEKILVIHDEVDLPFGTMKLQFDRGHGGQNGVRDIHAKLGTSKYYRMRIGVDRPEGQMDTAAHVLANFSAQQLDLLPTLFDKCATAFETLTVEGFGKAASLYNGDLLQ